MAALGGSAGWWRCPLRISTPTPTYMKTSRFLTAPLAIASIVLGALSLPQSSQGKPDKKNGSSKHSKKSQKHKNNERREDRRDDRREDRRDDHSGHEHDRARSHYHSRPRTSFSLNFGTGYAGQGYYYGPADVPYYYERPDVRYYRTRESAPREYWGSGYREESVGASVQQALARRGYYQGPIDGQIGPYSRREIARYQADQGLRPTGLISSSLLRSLGLQ